MAIITLSTGKEVETWENIYEIGEEIVTIETDKLSFIILNEKYYPEGTVRKPKERPILINISQIVSIV